MLAMSEAKFQEIKEIIQDKHALEANFAVSAHSQNRQLIDFILVLIEEIEMRDCEDCRVMDENIRLNAELATMNRERENARKHGLWAAQSFFE